MAAVATPLLGALRLAPPSPSFGAFGAGAAGWSASLPVGTMSGGARLAFHFGGKWWEKRMKHGTNMVLTDQQIRGSWVIVDEIRLIFEVKC